MRPSQCQRLLEIEQIRTSKRYGYDARVQQLKWATAISTTLYFLSRYHIWRHPRPQIHVWIDEVLVEVLEEGLVDYTCAAFLYMAMLFGLALVVALLCCRPSQAEREARARRALGLPSYDTPRRDSPSRNRRRNDTTSLRPVREAVAARLLSSDGEVADGTHAGHNALRQPRVDPTLPMRSSADLESFLQRASLEQRLQQRSVEGHQPALSVSADTGSFFPGTQPNVHSFFGPTGGDTVRPGAEGRIHVRYHQNGGSPSGGTAAGTDGSPRGLSNRAWEALGVHHLDQALGRTREWVSDLCRSLVEEVDACDRWLAANGAEAYDCSHSLREVLQVPAAPASAPAAMPQRSGFGVSSGMAWGASPMSAAPAAPQPMQTTTKQAALIQQRFLIQRSDHRNFDTILRLDQRVALEAKLDVTGTFPEATSLSNAELSARQQYVLRRLRAFGKQRTLVTYRHNGGDPEGWREGFPCDAHLLLHVVRTSVEGMMTYVRFGYQGGGTTGQDLSVYVGDTGEPYFYVRYRDHAQDRLYATRPGVSSLFEALLIFAAIIHVNHADVYGGVRGTMDLHKAKLTKVLREPTYTSGWMGTF